MQTPKVLQVAAVVKIGDFSLSGDWCNALTVASDDEEDETAELLRELEKIKKERAEQREREVRLTDYLLRWIKSSNSEYRSVKRPRKSRRSGNTTLLLGIRF